VPDFADFDRRRYETLAVREGYAAWAPTYEQAVDDVMDLELLDRIDTVDWSGVHRAADLGCGSGRTTQWLRARSATPIDGVDITPAMLELARSRGLHDRLVEADVRTSGLITQSASSRESVTDRVTQHMLGDRRYITP
jgi:predicted TPR repeat methyltransferase